MVHVPFLKVDLPEPRLQEILPGLVHFAVITCTHAFDAVHDFLRPLSTEQKAEVYMKSITHLPREFRLARKKLVENGVEDEDKMSEELEDAAFAFYRRRIREQIAGYSDEQTEDVTFRRLMHPVNEVAARDMDQDGDAGSSLLAQLRADAAAATEAEREAHAPTMVRLPSRGARAAVTTLAGGAGLALGAGAVQLLQLLRRLRRGPPGKTRPRRSSGAAAAASSRRASEQGGVRSGAGARTKRATQAPAPRKR